MDDVIFRTVTQTTGPSYGAFVEAGMTALPEYWDMEGSLNHFMLGAVDEWFSSRLAGISQAEGSVAYERLVFKPTIVGGMSAAEAGYRTPYGRVATAWRCVDGVIGMTTTVPVGCTATVYVPLLGETGGPAPMHDSGAVYRGTATLEDGEYARFEVGSGTWSFGTGGSARDASAYGSHRNIAATPGP